jgi:hypothetical protein
VVLADVLQARKKPPPARVWMRGRWWWPQTCRKLHLRLAFGCEGGGGGSRCVETSGSRLDAREVVVVANTLQARKKATFGSRLDARGGRVEPSRLDAREVEVAADVSKAR